MSTLDPAPQSPASASAAKVNKSTLFIVFLTVFIDLLGFGIVLPLLPRYGGWFNASDAQLGLLMASFSAMQFLFAPMWGSLSDRVGRRPILMLGLFGSAFSYTLFGFVSSQGRDFHWLGLNALAWLFVTRIGAGIAGATISTAQAVIADCTGPENRARGMALIGAAFGLGFTFGPLIGAVCVSDDVTVRLTQAQWEMVESWKDQSEPVSAEQFLTDVGAGAPLNKASQLAIQQLLSSPKPRSEVSAILQTPPSRMPGFVAGGLSAVALLIAAFRLQESRKTDGPSAAGHRAFRPGVMFRHLSRPSLGVILGAVFITTFGFAQFESTLSLLTQQFGFGTRSNFYLYAYVGVILSIGQGVLVRRLLPKIGEHRMAFIGVSLMTTGFILIGLAGLEILPAVSLWFILPIVVIGFSSVTPSLQSLLSRSASGNEQGAVLGTGQSLSSLARILGPAIGISLMGKSVAFPYFLGAALILCGGFLVTRIQKTPVGQ
ncbi:MAG: MFS transporter [Planctomycetaceae bacterium]